MIATGRISSGFINVTGQSLPNTSRAPVCSTLAIGKSQRERLAPRKGWVRLMM